ncbi:outer membrane autotransporter [Caballeronia temeraria]|uniref:Outer membrane autotransporter n=1 Tax=Caballeronia temeraria TaxID=1777137 RepID=A0A157ZX95_9BURK|nr:autotransporter-associated beta strand repeat-containing protein [Caballeronia temeraria]SAK50172.1 outer membrane autotransporter [Caballeronia temeraria]
MNEPRNRTDRRASFNTTLRPLAAVMLMVFASAARSVVVLNSSTTGQTVSTDTAYQVNAGTTITTTLQNAVDVTGIAPVVFTNAGTIISSTDNQAAAIRFAVNGQLINNVGGALLGHTYGVELGTGANSNVTNYGDISARISHGIGYDGDASGTVDNFGTVNNAVAGPISTTPDGVYLATTGAVTVNNHVGASIKSGTGDGTYGTAVKAEDGTGAVTVNNDGLISGYHGGVLGISTTPMIVNNSNSGVIVSGTTDPGVQLQQGSTLVNGGAISSTGGPAVLLAGANNTVTLGTGSQLNGGGSTPAITSHGTGNTITLTGLGTEDGAFDATSGNGYASLTSAAGSSWTLDGDVTLGGASPAALNVAGTLELGGTVTQNGGGTTVATGGILKLGAGGRSGALTGNVVNNGVFQFNRSDASTFAGVIVGTGNLVHAGGITALTGVGSIQNDVAVNAGTLALNQAGAFRAASFETNAGGTTAIGAGSSLTVSGAYTQASGGTLNVVLGGVQPIITANTAALNGTLNVGGFSAAPPATASALPGTQFNVIHTTGGITGDFTSVGFGSTSSAVDYLTLAGAKSSDNLNYNVGLGLTWLAGPSKGNGVFTLANATDTFNVDVALANQTGPFTTGWDGKTLTKNGAGTLIFSSADSYTGATLVNAGTLRTGIANAIAASGNVSVASGATLDLNGFTQQLNNLSGAGKVTLGSAALTVNESAATTFSGAISGSGGFTKTGSAALTLSGANTYTGGTTISAGNLIATSGNALGTGAVVDNAALQLDFASQSTLANVLSGTGALLKTGSGAATLTGVGSTQATVTVNAGALTFGQSGAFSTTGNYTTAAGAATTLSAQSTLNVGGAFATNGMLNMSAANAGPAVTANTATIGAGATANIAGYSAAATASASQLANSAFTAIHTTAAAGLSGTFSTVRIGGTSPTVDYLTLTSTYTPQDFVVGLGLTWYAAHGTTPQTANGLFTLVNSTDSFDMDAVLADDSANAATSWDGKTLTKAGAGTLQLSKANTYSGATLVNAGTLRAGAANVIADSSQLLVASGATFDLNGFAQQANDLSGAGKVTLGSAALTANNSAASTFSGVISGSGSLDQNRQRRVDVERREHLYRRHDDQRGQSHRDERKRTRHRRGRQ